MKKEYKKSRFYNNSDYEKKFKIKPYSKSSKLRVKNNLRQFVDSGHDLDDEYLDEIFEGFDDIK